MRLPSNILCLPTSILLLLAWQTNPAQAIGDNRLPVQWPRDLTAHVKYWLYGSASGKRDGELEKDDTVVAKSPVGILKMSEDEGEKFFMEYWRKS